MGEQERQDSRLIDDDIMGQGYSLLPPLGKHSVTKAAKAASVSAIEMTVKLTENDSRTTDAEKSKQLKVPKASNYSTNTEDEGATSMADSAQSQPEAGKDREDVAVVTMATCPKPRRPGLPDFMKEEGEEEGNKRPPPEGAVSESDASREGEILGVAPDFNKTDHQNIADKSSGIQSGIQNDSEAEAAAGNDVSAEGDNAARSATSGGRQKEARRNENEADRSVCDQILTADSSDKSPIAPGKGSKDFAGNRLADMERSQNLPCRQIARDRVRAGPRAVNMGPPKMASGSTQGTVRGTSAGSSALETRLRENLERVLIRELRGKLSGDEGGRGAIKEEAAKIKGDADAAAKTIKEEPVKIKRDRKGVNRGGGRDQPRTTGNGSGLLGDRRGWRAGNSVETGSRNPRDFIAVGTSEDDGKTKPEQRFQRLMTSSYSKRNKDDDDDDDGCHDDNDNGCHRRTTRPSRCNAQQRRGKLNSVADDSVIPLP